MVVKSARSTPVLALITCLGKALGPADTKLRCKRLLGVSRSRYGIDSAFHNPSGTTSASPRFASRRPAQPRGPLNRADRDAEIPARSGRQRRGTNWSRPSLRVDDGRPECLVSSLATA